MSEKATMVVSHKVRDYAEWRKGYDSDASHREKAGFSVVGVYTSAEDPNHVTLITEVPSAEMAKGFFNDPNLKEIMEKAGVIGTPEVKVLHKK